MLNLIFCLVCWRTQADTNLSISVRNGGFLTVKDAFRVNLKL